MDRERGRENALCMSMQQCHLQMTGPMWGATCMLSGLFLCKTEPLQVYIFSTQTCGIAEGNFSANIQNFSQEQTQGEEPGFPTNKSGKCIMQIFRFTSALFRKLIAAYIDQ
jgi:hypothetical protein